MLVNVFDSSGNLTQVDILTLYFSNLANVQSVTVQPSDFSVMLAVPCSNGGRRPVVASPSMFMWNQGGTSSQYIDGTGTPQTFPTIPAAQIQSDYNQSNSGSLDFIKNKPSIPSVLKTSSTLSLSITGSGATGTQISSSKDAEIGVCYSSQTTCTLGGNNTSAVIVKVCSTNSATESDWVEFGRTASNQPSGISVVVGQVVSQVGQVVIPVPLGYYVKAVSLGTGTHAEGFVSGWKTIFG